MGTEIFIVYDNTQLCTPVKYSQGFASIVKNEEKTILFDTGGNFCILLENMKKMGLNPAKIDAIVFSHLDDDHIGGLNGLLKINSKLDIYVPYENSEIKRIAKDYKVKIITDIEVVSEKIMLVYKEDTLSLIVRVKEELVMVASRIPEKILGMLKKIKELEEKNIYLLIAAFCLFSDTNIEAIADSFKKMGVKKIAPCHCCDEQAKSAFRKIYGTDYIPAGAGGIIKFTEQFSELDLIVTILLSSSD